jgi:hypothetical protein
MERAVSCYHVRARGNERPAIYREKWAVFRDQDGDWGRNLVLYLGRQDCGLQLRELGEAVGGIDYVSVGAALKRLGGGVSWEGIVAALEGIKAGKWESFCGRYGDWGRDAALWLGRRVGRLSLRALGELAG